MAVTVVLILLHIFLDEVYDQLRSILTTGNFSEV